MSEWARLWIAGFVTSAALLHFGRVIADAWPRPMTAAGLTDRQAMVLERARLIVAAWHRLVIG